MYLHSIIILDTVVSKMHPKNKSTVTFSVLSFFAKACWNSEEQHSELFDEELQVTECTPLTCLQYDKTVLLLCVKLLATCAA